MSNPEVTVLFQQAGTLNMAKNRYEIEKRT
jgi:hypothetical protein